MITVEQTGWFSQDAATFGDRIAGARDAAGMTQEQLARRLGVRLKTLQSWEDDLAEPRANRLQMMAGMLNVSLMWLLTGEGDGLDAPVVRGALSQDAKTVLADVVALRTKMQAMAQEMGQIEKRLRVLLREDAE